MAACARLQPSLQPRFLDVATARHKVERFDDVGRIEQPTAPSLAATLRQVGGRGVGYSQAQAAVLAADKPTTKRPYPFYIRTTAVFFWFGDRKKKNTRNNCDTRKNRVHIYNSAAVLPSTGRKGHIYTVVKNMVAQEENAAAPRQAGGAIHAIAHAAAQTKPSQSESESASPGPNVYLIGNVVHNDRGGCPPVIHGRQAAVSLLPGRIPYLELHRRLIELHLLRQERGWVGPIRARRQQSGVDQWRQRKQHRRRSSSTA